MLHSKQEAPFEPDVTHSEFWRVLAGVSQVRHWLGEAPEQVLQLVSQSAQFLLLFTNFPSAHDLQVVAEVSQVLQEGSQAAQVLPLKNFPSAHVLQVVAEVSQVLQEASQGLQSSVPPEPASYWPGAQTWRESCAKPRKIS